MYIFLSVQKKKSVIAHVKTKSQTTYPNALGQYGKGCEVYIFLVLCQVQIDNFQRT